MMRHFPPCRGLSPRVRGNLRPLGPPAQRGGSIPARAGEPKAEGDVAVGMTVYPRACGGTQSLNATSISCVGLSPRVRGNPIPVPIGPIIVRSIPARAGEPVLPCCTRPRWTVYPRACGGTFIVVVSHVGEAGLSPRVRGNPPPARARMTTLGSIPARAGEPGSCRRNRLRCGVYPRACGGTSVKARTGGYRWGLSPRVRGNHDEGRDRNVQGRSIPARAGEPHQHQHRERIWKVYPRACGGTPT